MDENAPTSAGLHQRRKLANTLALASGLACAVLLLWPPGRWSIYPACPIHAYLGILCPGCGATRALAALLNGRLGEAFRLNALFVLLLPFALAWLIESYRRALLQERFRWPRYPAPALYASMAAAALFTVARNL